MHHRRWHPPHPHTLPRSTAPQLIPTAPETNVNDDHGLSPGSGVIALVSGLQYGGLRICVVPTVGRNLQAHHLGPLLTPWLVARQQAISF